MINLGTVRVNSALATAVLLLLLVGVSGCSDGRLALGKINGVVTIDGEPLEMGQIVFVTDTRRAFGTIEDGQIVDVTTYQAGDGVAVGNHRVAIRPKVDEAELMKPPSKRSPSKTDVMVPSKYHKAETSGLSVEIKKGTNELQFELTSN